MPSWPVTTYYPFALVMGADNSNAASTSNPLPVRPIAASGIVNRSVSIISANVAQTLAATFATRNFLMVQNLDTVNALWLNFDATAVSGISSMRLQPMSMFLLQGGFVPTGSISVFTSSTSVSIFAVEG